MRGPFDTVSRAFVERMQSQAHDLGRKSNAALLAEAVGQSLTFGELSELTGGRVPIGPYSDFFKAGTDLRGVLAGTPLRALIALVRWRPTYGHYISVFETAGGDLEIFDSYGSLATPADGPSWGFPQPLAGGPRGGTPMAPSLRARLGQNAPYLLEAVDAAGYPRLVWNEWALQAPSTAERAVATCGRWAATRIAYRDIAEPRAFAALVRRRCGRLGCAPDELVTLATMD